MSDTKRSPEGKTFLRIGLQDAQERVTEVNKANGWFEDDRSVGEDLLLIHTEVSEAVEAFRDWGLADATDHAGAALASVAADRTILPKPEGFGSEMADILVRLLDTCERRGVDLSFEFERKLAHNATRGHKHGGKNL